MNKLTLLSVIKITPILILLLLTACSTSHFPWVYRIDVDQGNIVDKKKIDQLRVGMTKRQVRYLLGTPVIKDNFKPNEWIYAYTYETGKGKITRKKLVLNFAQEKLIEIQRHPEQSFQRDFY